MGPPQVGQCTRIEIAYPLPEDGAAAGGAVAG